MFLRTEPSLLDQFIAALPTLESSDDGRLSCNASLSGKTLNERGTRDHEFMNAMSDASPDQIGPPSVKLSAFQLFDSSRAFRDELERLHKALSGEAVLESHEPNVKVRVTASDGAGDLNVQAEITPDHLAQGHWFELEIDQSYLPAAIAQLESVLAKFPARGMDGGSRLA